MTSPLSLDVLARRARVILRRHPALQLAVLLLLWWPADALARALALPVPGSVLGLAVLLALFGTGVLPAACLRHGAGLLTRHLLLFFVPAVLALIDHPELVSLTGLKLVLAVFVGTVVVMAGTGLVVELSMRRLVGARNG